MTTSTQANTHSTDRTPVLAGIKTTPTSSKTTANRFSDKARRLLNTLMRSLASAHV